jgi:CubicO group peptidase (beta-lactamase class C family)
MRIKLINKNIILVLLSFLLVFPWFDLNSDSKKKDPRYGLIQAMNQIERNISSGFINSINKQVLKGGYVAIYSKGKPSLEINEILQKNSPIPVASISKPFTAFAILKLVEGGYVKLSHSIAKYIPEFIEFKDLKGKKEITVQDLLQHTSGIPYEGNRILVQVQITGKKYNIPIQSHPAGEKFIYSNHNYRLLARIIEATIGQTISEYVQEVILDPLEILDYNSTYYDGASGLAISPDGLYRFSMMILGGGRFEGREFMQRKYLKSFFRFPKISGSHEKYYGIGWQIQTSKDKKKIEAIWHGGKGDFTTSLLKIYPQNKTVVLIFMVQTRKNQERFLAINKETEKNAEKYMDILKQLETLPLKKFPPLE